MCAKKKVSFMRVNSHRALGLNGIVIFFFLRCTTVGIKITYLQVDKETRLSKEGTKGVVVGSPDLPLEVGGPSRMKACATQVSPSG